METNASIILQLKDKAQKLVALQKALRADNSRLLAQVDELKERIAGLETDNEQLNHRLKAMAVAKTVADTDEKNLALKLKINELVREIDHCIAQLNR
jgi:predicted nuclease with TOPRIM domain